MTPLRFVGRVFRQYWFIIFLGILILIPLLRTGFYQLTHFNALNCGSLLTHGDYWDADKTVGQQEIRCFVQAHQQCKAATLFETSQGTDISEEYTFRTANGLVGCAISVIGYEKGMCINRFGPFYCLLAPSIDSACTTMQQEHDGLRFLHCGNVQDIPFLI